MANLVTNVVSITTTNIKLLNSIRDYSIDTSFNKEAYTLYNIDILPPTSINTMLAYGKGWFFDSYIINEDDSLIEFQCETKWKPLCLPSKKWFKDNEVQHMRVTYYSTEECIVGEVSYTLGDETILVTEEEYPRTMYIEDDDRIVYDDRGSVSDIFMENIGCDTENVVPYTSVQDQFPDPEFN